MAEDAVESAGAKAPAITVSTQQIIAGEGVLMPDERCPAVHPKLGLQCDIKVWDCWGIDHICTRENGLGEFWRNELGRSPMHQYLEDWMVAKQNVTEEVEKEAMPTMNENTDSQSKQPHAGPPCPDCSQSLDLQRREPLIYWCALCRKWFDGELKRL